MAKCFTCGKAIVESAQRYNNQSFGGLFPSLYTCTNCENLNVLKDMRSKNESQMRQQSSTLDAILQGQKQGFETVQNELQAGFSGVRQDLGQLTSVVEWGLQDMGWRITQQTDVLKNIDQTLKTPRVTEANELRLMAEELYGRGVLNEAETRFLKAIDLNPLDYRTYIGAAHVYIAQGKFDDAQRHLESSLPHAPKKEIDYKSYSYRLIGRIHFSREDNKKAYDVLSQAASLSPNYSEAQYDYAQYAGLMANAQTAIPQLKTAISLQPNYWVLAQSEPTFDPVRPQVSALLSELLQSAVQQAQNQVRSVTPQIRQLQEKVSNLSREADAVDRSVIDRKTNRYEITQIENQAKSAQQRLQEAQQRINDKNFPSTLDAQKTLSEISDTLDNLTQRVTSAKGNIKDVLQSHTHFMEQKHKKDHATWAVWFATVGWLVTAIIAIALTILLHADFGTGFAIFVIITGLTYFVLILIILNP